MDAGASSPTGSLVADGTVDIKGSPADKLSTGGWKAAIFIFANEATDRISIYGIAANLVTYFTEKLHQGTATAAKKVNDWQGAVYLMPLLGAFMADAYWGRFRTIIVTSIVYLLGLILLTLSASLHVFKPKSCKNGICPAPSASHLGFFYFALYTIALGSGAMKPCVSSFGADQFDEKDASEYKKKTSFFNWWYLGVHAGLICSVTLLVYVQDNVGWSWGFGIPAGIMVFALAIFLFGSPLYRFKHPTGSPLTEIAQVITAAVKKHDMKVSDDPTMLYHMDGVQHTHQMLYLDKAAIRSQEEKEDQQVDPWSLCTVQQVENTKMCIRMIWIWLSCLPYYIVIAQINTLFVRQSLVMNRSLKQHSFQIPAASMQVFTSLTVVIFLPIYDRILVPLTRRASKNPRGITLLQRIGIGMVINVSSMLCAAAVETKRLKASKHGEVISVFWLLPQYVLLGLAEAFTVTGQVEFFYDQAPDMMRSFGAAFYLASIGVGNFLSSALISIVNGISGRHGKRRWIEDNINQGRLDLFYWLLGGLIELNMIWYVAASRCYMYKNLVPEKREQLLMLSWGQRNLSLGILAYKYLY